MVHSSCDRVHVLVLSAGVCVPYRTIRTFHLRKEYSAVSRYPCIYRYSLPYFWNAVRSDMGKGSLGTLLELGPEGDLGSGHMAVLYVVHPSQTYGTDLQEDALSPADILLLMPADVLVGRELPAVCPRQRTCI